MIELDIDIKIKKVKIDSNLKQSFKYPIIFYTVTRKSFYLCTFVILDFQKDRIVYIKTYNEDNVNKIKDNYNPEILKDLSHSSMSLNKDKFFNTIYSLISGVNNTFRTINIKTKKMKIYSGEDFGYDHLGMVTDTATKDIDENWFYMCFMRKDETITEYYKFSIDDLYNNEYLFKDKGAFKKKPHQIIRFKNFILSSGFSEPQGKILTYNINTKIVDEITTTVNPSHLVIKDDAVYYAASNMEVKNTKVIFCGAAKIGKLKIIDGVLKVLKEFEYKCGFRYTSHKYLNPDMLVAMGFPNRIIFIDAQSMEFTHYKDVDNKKILPDNNALDFLNDGYPQKLENPDRYTALECSEDGKYVIFFGQNNIKILNTNIQDIEFKIPFEKDEKYIQVTHHCDFLEEGI